MPSEALSSRGGVYRAGVTVRRPLQPWTPAIHALLRHLELVGFAGAPRVLGIEADHEVLTFVAGKDAHHTRDPRLHSDETLAAVGALIRDFHTAVASFVPPPDAVWQQPGSGSIICHNDLIPANTVYVNGQPKAFIDWELAGPAEPVWDLACAAWAYIPLYDDDFCLRHGYSTSPRGPRLRLLCDAYGLADRAGFLDVVRRRMRAQYDFVAAGAVAGNETFAAALAAGNGQRWLDAIDYLDANRDEWQRHLD